MSHRQEGPPDTAILPGGVRYRTDAHGVIVEVDPAWDEFASAAESPSVMSNEVTGRPLESFVSDPTTRMIYRIVAERVRQGHTLHFPFRCDAPDLRRSMIMHVTGLPDGHVEYSTEVEWTEPRSPVPVTGGPADSELTNMCGWCKRVLIGDRWGEIEEALAGPPLLLMTQPPLISHGICDECEQRMMGTFADPAE